MVPLGLLRGRLGLTRPDADLELKTELAAAVAMFEHLTNGLWEYRAAFVQEEYLQTETRRVKLQLLPVETITLVEETDVATGTTWNEVLSTDYLVVKRELVRPSSFWRQRVRVTYSGGYKADRASALATPLELVHALILQCVFSRQRNSEQAIAMKSQGLERVTAGYIEGDVSPTLARVAKLWRRP